MLRVATSRFVLGPNIVAVSAAVFLMALGENLWKRFVPKYLEGLGPRSPRSASAEPARTASTAPISIGDGSETVTGGVALS